MVLQVATESAVMKKSLEERSGLRLTGSCRRLLCSCVISGSEVRACFYHDFEDYANDTVLEPPVIYGKAFGLVIQLICYGCMPVGRAYEFTCHACSIIHNGWNMRHMSFGAISTAGNSQWRGEEAIVVVGGCRMIWMGAVDTVRKLVVYFVF